MARDLPAGTITMLFTDVEGSTALLRTAGAGYGDLLADQRRLLREAWSRHGGVEVDAEGDGSFVVFRVAQDGADAAADAQRALASHAWPHGVTVRVRMGLHTGAPELRDDRYLGEDVHYAARVGDAGHGGQVLLSASTRELVSGDVAPLGEHALKDFPRPRPLFQLVVDGVGPEVFPPPRTAGPARLRLPPTGDLVGREPDVRALAARVTGEERLVTIAGPGGSGKTKVAVELGHRLAGAFPDAVAFVALEELSDPGAAPAAVAHALNLPERAGMPVLDRVAEHLRDRRVLLILDNFEHLLDLAPAAARLAVAGDGVRVVVTSQVPLRVGVEHVHALAPLEEDDAVALLLARARAAAPGFAPGPEDEPALRELCRRLDGSPLALELAAGRLALLSPAELLGRLDDSLEALGRGARDLPPRQRGLRAMLDWTSSLLDEPAREVLARLSVFAGGFTVDGAEDALGDVLDAIAQLVDAGLVRRGDDRRLAMSPPVRRYAAGLLAAGGAEREAHLAHAESMARLTETFEARWLLRVPEASRAFNPEAANLLEALAWTRREAPELHARLVAGLGWWMNYRDQRAEAREHLATALDRTADPRMRARLLSALGPLQLETSEWQVSAGAADAWRALGDPEREVLSRYYATNLAFHGDDVDRCRALAAQALETARASGDADLVWLAETGHSIGLIAAGRSTEATAVLERLFERARPGTFMTALAATTLADAELYEHRDAEAVRHYGVAMRELMPTGSVHGLVLQAVTIGLGLARLGRHEEAGVVVGVCEVAHRELASDAAPLVARTLAEAAGLVEPAALEAGRARAAEMGLNAGLRWTVGAAEAVAHPQSG